MIVIPIGQEGALGRKPFVTMGLAVILTLIHIYTHLTVPDQLERHKQAKIDYGFVVLELQTWMDAKYIGDPGSMPMPDIGGNYLQSLKAMKDFQERRLAEVETEMEAGKLFPIGSKVHDEWLAARDAVRQTKEDILFYKVGLIPAEASVGALFSSMFFHADFLHLIFNLVFLVAAGCLIESAWGHVVYALAYIVCGIAAGVAHWNMMPDSLVPAIGASGAIAGMMGACLVVYFRERIEVFWFYLLGIRIRHGVSTLPAYVLLGSWIFGQVFWAVVTKDMGDTVGVAFWAHIGGFASGAVLALILRSTEVQAKLRPPERVPQESAGGGVAVASVERDASVGDAQFLYNQGKKDEACRILEEALAADDSLLDAHGLLGRIRAEKWEVAKAKVHCEKAIEGYCAQREAERAYAVFDELRRACPKATINLPLLFRLSGLLRDQGAREKAAELALHLATSFASDPLGPKAGLKAGKIYEKLGNLEAAKQGYEIATRSEDSFMKAEAEKRLRKLEAAAARS